MERGGECVLPAALRLEVVVEIEPGRLVPQVAIDGGVARLGPAAPLPRRIRAAQRVLDLGRVRLHPVEERVQADGRVMGEVDAEWPEAVQGMEGRLRHQGNALSGEG